MIDAIPTIRPPAMPPSQSPRAQGGIGALKVSHVAHQFDFDTPSRRIEFVSKRRGASDCPELPEWRPAPAIDADHPLVLTGPHARKFSRLYNNGCAELPTLATGASANPVWMSDDGRRRAARPCRRCRASVSTTRAVVSPRARRSPNAFRPAHCGCATRLVGPQHPHRQHARCCRTPRPTATLLCGTIHLRGARRGDRLIHHRSRRGHAPAPKGDP